MSQNQKQLNYTSRQLFGPMSPLGIDLSAVLHKWLRWRVTKINDIHDLLYTAIFEKRWYLVAAFAVSLACAVLRYRLLKVSSVTICRHEVAGPTFRRVACVLHAR